MTEEQWRRIELIWLIARENDDSVFVGMNNVKVDIKYGCSHITSHITFTMKGFSFNRLKKELKRVCSHRIKVWPIADDSIIGPQESPW